MSTNTGKQVVKKENKDTPVRIFIDFLHMLRNVCTAFVAAVLRFFIPPDRKSVKNEIVLVTGSARGLGRELSKEFAKLGSILVLWDVDETGNEETAQQIRVLGGTCHPYTCDVSDRHAVYACGARVKSDIGDVSILVNNAGRVTGKRLIDCSDDAIEKTFNVNLLAHFWTVKCFLPTMLRNNHGHVVSLSSATGFVGVKNLADYSASKFGVVGLTEVLNYEIIFAGYDGVHTTLVCPSYLRVGMFESCKIRFPRLTPPLELTPTVNRIMQGILTNQGMVCLPRSVYFLNVLKTILPVDVMTEVIMYFGAADFMETFVKQDSSESDNPIATTSNGDTAHIKEQKG